MTDQFAPLTEQCAKALGDKTYEKRKLAAQEIEKMIMEAHNTRNEAQIRKLIELLTNQFLNSRDPNKKKGGLIGLAATAIALGKVKFLFQLELPFTLFFLLFRTRKGISKNL